MRGQGAKGGAGKVAERMMLMWKLVDIQEAHLQTVVEVLQSIKASDMTPMLQRIYAAEGGSEALDVLMKYLWVTSSRSFRPLYIPHLMP